MRTRTGIADQLAPEHHAVAHGTDGTAPQLDPLRIDCVRATPMQPSSVQLTEASVEPSFRARAAELCARKVCHLNSLESDMSRRAGGGARVVPNLVPATSSSSNLAVVFTPLVPIDHVADDGESGTAAALGLFPPSSVRYREDGKE